MFFLKKISQYENLKTAFFCTSKRSGKHQPCRPRGGVLKVGPNIPDALSLIVYSGLERGRPVPRSGGGRDWAIGEIKKILFFVDIFPFLRPYTSISTTISSKRGVAKAGAKAIKYQQKKELNLLFLKRSRNTLLTNH